MPRIGRITVENGCYHIITRGNQKQPVFMASEDYKKYLKILTSYKKRYLFKLYAFCLMPNHVHLMLEVNEPTRLNKIMRGLNLSYTLYFNSKYNKVGHLWQDRFKSKIIQGESYLLKCVDYIETNPLRTNLTLDLNLYPWSSYRLRLIGNTMLDEISNL